MAAIRLGDLLVKAKVLTESQLKAALSEQQKWGGKLGEILVRMELLSEEMLVKALSKQMAVPAVNLEQVNNVPPHVRAKIPPEVARDLVVVPLQIRDDGRTLVVAMSEPQNLKLLDELRSITRCRIVAQIAGRKAIARAFGRFYEGEAEVSAEDSSFKVLNSQGHTLIRNTDEIAAQRDSQRAAKRQASQEVPAAPAAPVTTQPMRVTTLGELPSTPTGSQRSPGELLRAIEEAQRKEVAALKAMVEVLIEKGVFSREEYLARVKR